MYEELKKRQQVIYARVMRMYDNYKELDKNVDQLFELSDEETQPPPPEPEDPTKTELAKAEDCI